jgi:hypothetical protein
MTQAPGGMGGDSAPSPAEVVRDVRLKVRALVRGWRLSPEMQEEVAGSLCDQLISLDPRYAIQAARALMQGDLAQQRLDLDRERLEGAKSEVSLADLVEAAEHRAEERVRERAKESE